MIFLFRINCMIFTHCVLVVHSVEISRFFCHSDFTWNQCSALKTSEPTKTQKWQFLCFREQWNRFQTNSKWQKKFWNFQTVYSQYLVKCRLLSTCTFFSGKVKMKSDTQLLQFVLKWISKITSCQLTTFSLLHKKKNYSDLEV